MNLNHIQSQTQQSKRRNLGDQPDIGPVARIPGAAKRLARSRRRGRRSRRSEIDLTDRRRRRQLHARKFAIRLWAFLILTACSGILLAVSFLWLRAQSDRRKNAPVWAQAESLPALMLTDFPPPSEREMIDVIHGALGAKDPESLVRFVHSCDEVSPDQMLAFFSATAERDGSINSYRWVGSTDTESQQVQSMILGFDKEGAPSHRLLALVPTEAGEWKLDFPSYARWCDPPIHLLGAPDGHPGGRMRVYLMRDYYFNGVFADDREWACYLIASPDVDGSGYGYCKLHSPEHESIQRAFAQGGGEQIRVTMNVERVEGAQAHQLLITGVTRHDWLSVRSSPESD